MCMVLYLNKRSIKNVFCQIWLNPVVLEKKMKMRKIYRAGNQESSLEHSAQLKMEIIISDSSIWGVANAEKIPTVHEMS